MSLLEELLIKNFKCYSQEKRFALRPLTLLCGTNAAGKSTVLQALRIIRDAALAPSSSAPISLNFADGFELGEVGDVLSNTAADSRIELAVEHADASAFRCSIDAGPDRIEDLHLTILDTEGDIPSSFLSTQPSSFTYLLAERSGPRDHYVMRTLSGPDIQVGLKGEHTAQLLLDYEIRPTALELRHPAVNAALVRQQVEAWLSEVVTDVQLRVRRHQEANLCSLYVKRPGIQAEWRRPVNLGFGLTYALPIFVAALTASRGSLLLVDSPEAHLHPAAQSRMGAFLSRLAGTGVQVIVETHSDHIINGMRRAVAVERCLDSADVVVHNFSSVKDGESQHSALNVASNGELDDWPPGFFDQIQRDLSTLVRARTQHG